MSDGQKLDRLIHLHARGRQLHEQLEAVAAECCDVMGVDPSSDTIERDWCDEIALHGTDPTTVFNRVMSLRRVT